MFFTFQMLFHEDSKTISLGKYGSARNIITRVFYFPFFFTEKNIGLVQSMKVMTLTMIWYLLFSTFQINLREDRLMSMNNKTNYFGRDDTYHSDFTRKCSMDINSKTISLWCDIIHHSQQQLGTCKFYFPDVVSSRQLKVYQENLRWFPFEWFAATVANNGFYKIQIIS